MAARIKVEGAVRVYTDYGETEAEFYFHTTLKKYKGMIEELYQLRNIKGQTLQSDKVRRQKIIHAEIN